MAAVGENQMAIDTTAIRADRPAGLGGAVPAGCGAEA